MEELRTTEALDREILEDARKKAHKILKSADDRLASQSGDWEKKTQEAVDAMKKVYQDRVTKTGEEILARLPLDKRRLRSETAENLLVKAMNDFLRSLKRETLLSILERDLFVCLKDCLDEDAGEKTKTLVTYSGLELAEARAVTDKVIAGLSKKTGGFSAGASDWDFTENKIAHEFPSLVINTRNLKITSSVESAAAALLKDKRAELAAALLGEGVLND